MRPSLTGTYYPATFVQIWFELFERRRSTGWAVP